MFEFIKQLLFHETIKIDMSIFYQLYVFITKNI